MPETNVERDTHFMRLAIEGARRAGARGDRPYGAVLVDAQGNVLAEGENTTATAADVTGHAETNVLRDVLRRLSPVDLADGTLYASGEPCAMCSVVIYWSGIGRVVYGASSPATQALLGVPADRLDLRCADVLARGTRRVQVDGPFLENEALRVFEPDTGRA